VPLVVVLGHESCGAVRGRPGCVAAGSATVSGPLRAVARRSGTRGPLHPRGGTPTRHRPAGSPHAYDAASPLAEANRGGRLLVVAAP
jgi:hypothetical protein